METVSDCPTKPILLSLPAELRNQIFTLAVTSNDIIALWQRSTGCAVVTNSSDFGLPPLSQVCRQARQEVLPIFFSTNTFAFHVDASTSVGTPREWYERAWQVDIWGLNQLKTVTLVGVVIGVEAPGHRGIGSIVIDADVDGSIQVRVEGGLDIACTCDLKTFVEDIGERAVPTGYNRLFLVIDEIKKIVLTSFSQRFWIGHSSCGECGQKRSSLSCFRHEKRIRGAGGRH